jgi:hypothetical protein
MGKIPVPVRPPHANDDGRSIRQQAATSVITLLPSPTLIRILAATPSLSSSPIATPSLSSSSITRTSFALFPVLPTAFMPPIYTLEPPPPPAPAPAPAPMCCMWQSGCWCMHAQGLERLLRATQVSL